MASEGPNNGDGVPEKMFGFLRLARRDQPQRMLDKGATCSLLSKCQNTLPNTTFLKESLSEYNLSKKPALARSRLSWPSWWRIGTHPEATLVVVQTLLPRPHLIFFVFVFCLCFFEWSEGVTELFWLTLVAAEEKWQKKRKKKTPSETPKWVFPDTKGQHISKHSHVKIIFE